MGYNVNSGWSPTTTQSEVASASPSQFAQFLGSGLAQGKYTPNFQPSTAQLGAANTAPITWKPPTLVNGKFQTQEDIDAFKAAISNPGMSVNSNSIYNPVPGSSLLSPSNNSSITNYNNARQWGMDQGFIPKPQAGSGFFSDFVGGVKDLALETAPIWGAALGGAAASGAFSGAGAAAGEGAAMTGGGSGFSEAMGGSGAVAGAGGGATGGLLSGSIPAYTAEQAAATGMAGDAALTGTGGAITAGGGTAGAVTASSGGGGAIGNLFSGGSATGLGSTVGGIGAGIGGLSQAGILGSLGNAGANFYDANQRAQSANTAASLADPFASQRPQYQQQLSQLMANPNSFAQNPAYQFAVQQGQNALERSDSARGYLNSGNILHDLQAYGQQSAYTGLQGQQNLLAGLAGANAGNTGAAATNYNNANGQSISQMYQGISGLGTLGAGLLNNSLGGNSQVPAVNAVGGANNSLQYIN